MRLYLVQHGEAASEAEDPKRPLTARGGEQVRGTGAGARRLDVRPAKIFHSGKLRAEQTATIIGESLRLPASVLQSGPGLNPNDEVRPWAEKISGQKEDWMLVGHLPFLQKLASYLLSGNETAKLVLFQYGAIVCLEQKEDKGWAVRWILTPEMCAERIKGTP
jgi:phosphohistidine phosphatase